MKKIKSNKGVTLMVLVITITVLLILAGFATYSGVDTLRSAKLTIFTTELKIVQNKVNEIYDEYKDKTVQEIINAGVGKNKDLLAKNIITAAFNGAGITAINDFVYWDNEIIKKIGIDKVKGKYLVNFKTRQVISVEGYTYEGQTYYTLEQVPKGFYNVNYNEQTGVPTFDVSQEKISDEKWKIKISNIQYQGNIKKWEVEYITPNGKKKTTEEMSFIVDKAGKYVISIQNGNIISGTREIEIIGGLMPGEVATKTEKDNYTDKRGKKATIPVGFSIVPGCETIDEGLVISDNPTDTEKAGQTKQALGNQFVWIPVISAEVYQRDFSYPSWYNSELNYTPKDSTYTDIGYLPSSIQPVTDNATDNENAERQAVLKYNGFYIGRYEAGREGQDTVVCKNNVPVYNNISQTDAKIKAKELCSGNSNVECALCSGIQWDTVMKFVDGKNDAKGKRYNVRVADLTRHTNSLANTGLNDNDKVQNIYDLEGNVLEYIAEKNKTSHSFVDRGGAYIEGTNFMTSTRLSSDGINDSTLSFRPTLYIK